MPRSTKTRDLWLERLVERLRIPSYSVLHFFPYFSVFVRRTSYGKACSHWRGLSLRACNLSAANMRVITLQPTWLRNGFEEDERNDVCFSRPHLLAATIETGLTRSSAGFETRSGWILRRLTICGSAAPSLASRTDSSFHDYLPICDASAPLQPFVKSA